MRIGGADIQRKEVENGIRRGSACMRIDVGGGFCGKPGIAAKWFWQLKIALGDQLKNDQVPPCCVQNQEPALIAGYGFLRQRFLRRQMRLGARGHLPKPDPVDNEDGGGFAENSGALDKKSGCARSGAWKMGLCAVRRLGIGVVRGSALGN